MLDLHTKFEDLSLPTRRDIFISSVTEERTGVNQCTPAFFKAGVLYCGGRGGGGGFPEWRGQILHAVGLFIQTIGRFDLFCTRSSSICTAINIMSFCTIILHRGTKKKKKKKKKTDV